jgi:hypothetical protein
MFASSAALLDAMKARLEALVPTGETAGDQPAFTVRCEEADVLTGPRTVELTAMGGRHPEQVMFGANWETQVTIRLISPAVRTEPGSHTAHQMIVADSEEIIADLQTWAGASDVTIRPDLASIQNDGQGNLESTRTIQVRFQKG